MYMEKKGYFTFGQKKGDRCAQGGEKSAALGRTAMPAGSDTKEGETRHVRSFEKKEPTRETIKEKKETEC